MCQTLSWFWSIMIRVLLLLKKHAYHVTSMSKARHPLSVVSERAPAPGGRSHLLRDLAISPPDVKCSSLGPCWILSKPGVSAGSPSLSGKLTPAGRPQRFRTGSSILETQVSFAPFHFLLCLQDCPSVYHLGRRTWRQLPVSSMETTAQDHHANKACESIKHPDHHSIWTGPRRLCKRACALVNPSDNRPRI